MRNVLFLLLILSFWGVLPMGRAFSQEGDIPRFVTLSADEVYVRAGPGKQYPVKWIYRSIGYPVEIIREFEHWRKIEDREGNSGWVYKGLLSGRRSAIIMTQNPEERIWLLRQESTDSQKIARIEPNAIISINQCNTAVCQISAQGITGWISRKYLWGIYDHEIIE